MSLPFRTGKSECEPPKYGFYWYESALWWCWGKKVYAFHAPWSFNWHRTSILLKNGLWEHETKGNKKDFWDKKWEGLFWEESHPYTYTLKKGTIQNRTATIKVEEREWRRRCLMWTKLFSLTRKTIDVRFNDEVGDRTGSWKGGCLGCSYDILPNESPMDTLRRMEKERIFK